MAAAVSLSAGVFFVLGGAVARADDGPAAMTTPTPSVVPGTGATPGGTPTTGPRTSPSTQTSAPTPSSTGGEVTATPTPSPSSASTRQPSATTSPTPAPRTSTPSTPSTPSSPSTRAKAADAGSDAIDARWQELGGAGGVLGAPVGGTVVITGGEYQRYAKGRIWWSSATGAWETTGTTDQRFTALGGAAGSLGFPSTAARPIAGGTWQWFAGGIIWASASTGAWETTGTTNTRYLAISGPWGIGFPTSAQQPIAGGTWQWFTSGNIWASAATGAWETTGTTNARYLAIRGPWGMGFPTSAQQPIAGGTWQWFTSGNIWASAATGAWETTGATNARYLAIRGPWGIGFPTRNLTSIDDGKWQWFGNGIIWWSATTGAWETTGAIKSQFTAQSGPYSLYGFPTGAARSYYGGARQDFVGGSLLSNVQAVLDPVRSPVRASDVWATWRPGCPVGPESLTLIRLNFYGFDHTMHRGEIIVRSDLASRVEAIFGAALAARQPIRSMWRVDYYGGSDPAAMAADNTSGFNCRQVTGGSGLSPHSYGIAIDIDTVENPYYAGGRWWPTTQYVNRGDLRWGMLYSWSGVTRAFASNGYEWGGSYLDYQHFEFVG